MAILGNIPYFQTNPCPGTSFLFAKKKTGFAVLLRNKPRMNPLKLGLPAPSCFISSNSFKASSTLDCLAQPSWSAPYQATAMLGMRKDVWKMGTGQNWLPPQQENVWYSLVKGDWNNINQQIVGAVAPKKTNTCIGWCRCQNDHLATSSPLTIPNLSVWVKDQEAVVKHLQQHIVAAKTSSTGQVKRYSHYKILELNV